MRGKENLLEEICPKLTIKSDFIIESFTDQEAEKDYMDYQSKNSRTGLITICIIVFIVNVYNLAYSIYQVKKGYLTAIFSLLTIFDFSLFICLFKINLCKQYNLKIRFLKHIINVIYSFAFLFMYIIFDEDTKDISIARLFYGHGLILCAQYMYLIRTNSKLIFSMFFGYLIIILIASFTTFRLEFIAKNNRSFLLSKSCTNLVNYTDWINSDKEKIMSNIYERIDEIISDYNTKEVTTQLFEAIQLSIITNSTTFDFMGNKIPLDSLDLTSEDSIKNLYLTKIMPLYIDQMLNAGENQNSCFVYYYSDLITTFLSATQNFMTIEIHKKYDYFNFRVEIISCIFGPCIYYLLSLISKYRREIYIKVKQTEALIDYCNNLIDNMHCQVISMTEDKILFNNIAYTKGFKLVVEKNGEAEKSNLNKDLEANCLFTSSNILDSYIEDLNSVSYYFPKLTQECNCDNNNSPLTLLQIIEDLKKEQEIEVIGALGTQESVTTSKNLLINQPTNSNSNFIFYGTFTYNKILYYNVFIRKLTHKEKKYILDVMLDDVTDVKRAEKINFETKLKQKLFSKIAHEFKTPLLIIKSLVSEQNSTTDLMEKEIKSKNICHLSDYIGFLINDIICYSNNTEIKIIQENVDIEELIDFCEGLTKSLIAVMPGNKENIRVVTNKCSNTSNYYIVSDSARLKQVLLNFISNAVKFTKFGQITLVSEIEETQSINSDSYDAVLKLKIIDTGIGISEEDGDKIRQSSNNLLSINTDYKYNQMGSGLGIGIAKSIISKLGYKLKIQSQVEKGSEFTVIIPNPIKKESNFKTVVKSRRSSISEKTRPIFSFKYSNDSMIKDSSVVLNNLQKSFFSIPFQEIENYDQNYESENMLNSCSNLKIIEEKKSNKRKPNYSVDLYRHKECDCSLSYNNKIKKYLDSQFPSTNIVKKPNSKPVKTVTFNTNGGFQLNMNNIVPSNLNYQTDASHTKNIILIVDDANMIRQSVKKVVLANKFISENFNLLEANDGIDMLSLVIHHQNNGNYIKLIITDENMEYMCGSAAIEIIRQLEKEKKIRRIHVVSLTAFSDEETINEIYNKRSR